VTPKRSRSRSVNELIFELAKLPDEASRREFLGRYPRLLHANVVQKLAEAVREQVRVDVGMALRLAESALFIAGELGDGESMAYSLRAKANALWFKGECRPAAGLFEKAAVLFEEAGNLPEVGRTLSTSIQSLALLGEYEQARSAADRAREIFTRLGDERRLARLEINVANILHRRDLFAEALEKYERAYQLLLPYKDTEAIGVALQNMAVCLISLNDFDRALETYERARTFCDRHGMPLLVSQADYNIAYLYYLRGDYTSALGMLRSTREACRKNGDAYHAALCNLDQSEIYLELNLTDEAAEMAQEASVQFEQLGMRYEAARSLVNLAIAQSQQRKAPLRALELFAQAREKLAQEGNRVWPSLIDLYQALVLYDQGRFSQARRLCAAALEFFRSSPLPRKAVVCRLLLARLSLRDDDLDGAAQSCRSALENLEKLEAPVLNYQAHFLMGRVQEASGDDRKAYDSYQRARLELETVRGGLQGEELKIAFMKDKQEVYEGLIQLCLSGLPGTVSSERAFGFIEQAKSRTLFDAIFGRAVPLPVKRSRDSELALRIRDLREALNWHYHRIEVEQTRADEVVPERIEQLRAQARSREHELQRLLREMPFSVSEETAFRTPAALTLEEIRASLAPDTVMLEYFRVRERMVAAVLTRNTLEILSLAAVSEIAVLLRKLSFQLSKFRLGSTYAARVQEPLLRGTQHHLQQLYQAIFPPSLERLEVRHLVVVPHDALHYVPFHALFDGRQYLIDRFTVSYAPSASVYAICHRKAANTEGPCLILGISDPKAPFIEQEVESVAAIVREPQLLVGAAASEEALREKGPRSRFIHIATHGYFREDNPMFSGIRLGDSYLSLYDLYHLELPVELLTLSGCLTGRNVVAAGDELVGLVRGLLYAGAQSLVLTLWEVDDRSTSDFMTSFYRRLCDHHGKAVALQGAMIELRGHYPHPYYWAPFMLIGKAYSS
jgi:CHAT domain-containing protein/tetratricopeptide (TPR) repeat protein